LQGQLKVAEIKERKCVGELKRLQALLLERDTEIEKLSVTNNYLRTESNKIVSQLRQQMTGAVRRVD
jgi:hypothetical protein